MKKYKIICSVIILTGLCLGYKCYKYYREVNVDKTAPIISYDGDLVISVNASLEELLSGVKAIDEVDGDVSDTLVIENYSKISDDNKVNVTYAAYDKSNNVAKVTRIIEYTDYQLPQFKLNKPLIFNSVKLTSLLGSIEAYNVRGENISNRIRVQYQQDPSEMNKTDINYPINFAVTDELGGTKSITLNVDIVDNKINYNNDIEVNLKDYLIYVDKNEKINLSRYLDSIVYQNEEQRINYRNLEIETDLDTSVSGVYDVYFNYTLSNNLSGYSKLVVVVN